MRRFGHRFVVATCSVALCLPGIAAAWGPMGHEVIATVARNRLKAQDPALLARFYKIFKGDVLRVDDFDKKTGAPLTCHGRTLQEIANWADCIRYTKKYSSTGKFHFNNASLCAETPPPPPVVCDQNKCASGALAGYIATAKNPAATRFQRAEAVAWVIHIVGDLHQPLHTEQNNDSGGATVAVKLPSGLIPGASLRQADGLPKGFGVFHGLWDTPMAVAAVGADIPQAVADLTQYVAANASDPAWASSDPFAWAWDSHAIARDAYARLPMPPACGAGSATGGVIDANYVAAFKGPVKDQMGRAAFRLSVILSDILS